MEIEDKENLVVKADKYNLEFLHDRPYVKVTGKNGEVLSELFLISSCHALEGRDVSSTIGNWNYEKRDGRVYISADADSSFWDDKKYHIVCLEDRFEYYYEIEGKGHIDECQYFSGYYTGSLRWGSGRMFSGFEIDRVFNPEPDSSENYYYSPGERVVIDMMGVPVPGKDHWFFTPPPFCFVGIKQGSMFTMGVKACPGLNTYTEYTYEGGRGGYLTLSYEGHTKVDGKYILPSISFIFGNDEYKLLHEYCNDIRINTSGKTGFEWWGRPIFCGWGAQCSLSPKYELPAPKLSTEKVYYEFMKTIKERGLNPGTIVIDDKWQQQYGLNRPDIQKWPNMKRFIDDMHNDGRRVLLWLKAWDPEGVEEKLCITDFTGKKIAVDPTNPEYERLFRDSIRYMLSEDGLGADGFKIDFTARIPSSPYCKTYSEIWGLELMKKYLGLIYTEAKKTKKDALVMSHTPHPYLEDVVDMIRLNDINTSSNVNRSMVHRAKVARASCPTCMIDTDNWPMPDKSTWLNYIKIQPTLGVPSLYYLWKIDNSGEEITAEDLKVVKKTWDEYSFKKGMEIE